MSYLTSQNDTAGRGVEFVPVSAPLLADKSVAAHSDKWPIAWTAWGLIAFCGVAWAALLSLIF